MPNHIPNVGIQATRFWESQIGTLPNMGVAPRQVLAANLDRLMRETEHLRTLERLSADCGISRGTLDRIRRALVSTGVDQLEAIGKSFGLEPYQLMTPQDSAEKAKTPPNLETKTEEGGLVRTKAQKSRQRQRVAYTEKQKIRHQ